MATQEYEITKHANDTVDKAGIQHLKSIVSYMNKVDMVKKEPRARGWAKFKRSVDMWDVSTISQSYTILLLIVQTGKKVPSFDQMCWKILAILFSP